uniref:Uncharacterized protein n=1 Tax=Haptolina ericina TaxID=156174 RepID=A0A7S3AWH3_9EUKA
MQFVKPPSSVGIPWRFDVLLEDWVPDVLLTLNFIGDSYQLKGHPLQIESVSPPGLVWEDSITTHSVTYRLRPLPPNMRHGGLQIVAYGMIDGLGGVQCCCGSPPPPPPTLPSAPPDPPLPSPHPRRPPPPPFEILADREIGGREEYQVGNDGKATLIRTADGKTKAAPPPTSGKSHVTLQIGLTAAMVGLFGFMGKKFMTKLQDSQAEKEKDAKIKQTLEDIKKRKTQAEVEATKMRASKRSNAMQPVEADDGSPSETSEVMSALEPTEDHTQLLMEVGDGPAQEAAVDLDNVETMKALQRLVLVQWEMAGGKSSDGLMMEYTDDDGQWVPVTRSSSIDAVKMARTIRLAPKRKATKGGSQYNQLGTK